MEASDPPPVSSENPAWSVRVRESMRGFWNSAIDWVTRTWRVAVDLHLFTVPAVILAFFLVFYFPQTRNVLWQLPALDYLTIAKLLSSFVQWASILILLLGYIGLAWVLTPDEPPETGRSGEARGRWVRIRDRIDTILDDPINRAARRTARAGWVLLILGGVALFLSLRFNSLLPAWWRVSGLTYATLVGLLGVWLIGVNRGRGTEIATGEVAAQGLAGYKARLTGRALFILIGTVLLGQILWALPDWLPGTASPRIYTIWAVVQVSFLIVAISRVIDACHVHSTWNIRALAVLGIVLWLFLIPNQKVGRFWRLPPRPTELAGPPPGGAGGSGAGSPTSFMPSAQTPSSTPLAPGGEDNPGHDRSPILPMDETLSDIWFRSMEAKLAATSPDHPVVFLSASGGGARAALFTSLVLEALRGTQLPPRIASRPLPSTSEGAEPGSLADQIVLISSVSGGSLASAYYVSQSFPHVRVLRDRELPPDQQMAEGIAPRSRVRFAWHNTSPSELYARMHTRAIQMLDAVRQGRGRSVRAWAGPRFEEAVERVAYECERLATGRNTWQNQGASATPIAPWLATSAFVDDMATDFMAPLLRGILTPGVERGVSVTRYWEDRFGWRDVEDTDLHRRPHPEHPELGMLPNAAPPVLFNASDVTQGSRLILGFPPLPAGIIRDPLALPSSHLPYSLTDLGDLYYHVSLAEAVRLSANFPFGFEVGELPLSGGESTIMVLDGGIVDNSGIDSIVYLLQGLDRLAKAYRAGWARLSEKFEQAKSGDEKQALWDELTALTCRSVEGRAYRLLGELARRKIVLIQVDSGSKEIQTQGSGLSSLLAGLSPGLFRPFQALNNATNTNADQAVEGHDRALRILHPLPPPPCDCANEPIMLAQMEPPVPMAPTEVAPAPQAPSKVFPIPGTPMGPVLHRMPKPPQELPEMPPLICRVRLTCNQFANVMTAWTLGPEDKAQVLVQFLIEWEHQRPVILKCLEILSRIQTSRPEAGPEIQPYLLFDPGVARDYAVYQRGQKLVDRARAEFYQMVSSPGAVRALPGITSGLLVDDIARQDLKDFDQLFREIKPSASGPWQTLPGSGAPIHSTPVHETKPADSVPPAPPVHETKPADSVPPAPPAPSPGTGASGGRKVDAGQPKVTDNEMAAREGSVTSQSRGSISSPLYL
ncbi:MAG: hypothetical protein ACLQGP_12390 [Isosphaeraceae bacterium]